MPGPSTALRAMFVASVAIVRPLSQRTTNGRWPKPPDLFVVRTSDLAENAFSLTKPPLFLVQQSLQFFDALFHRYPFFLRISDTLVS